jgi:3-dehydroquinate synthase
MVIEARAAEALGIAEEGTAEKIGKALAALGLPTTVPAVLDPAAVLAATRSDKKARAGTVEYALPCRIGEMAGAAMGYGIRVEDEVVLKELGERS